MGPGYGRCGPESGLQKSGKYCVVSHDVKPIWELQTPRLALIKNPVLKGSAKHNQPVNMIFGKIEDLLHYFELDVAERGVLASGLDCKPQWNPGGGEVLQRASGEEVENASLQHTQKHLP